VKQEAVPALCHADLRDAAVVARLDTASIYDTLGLAEAYPLACAWALAHDRRRITYRSYLTGAAQILQRGTDTRWVTRATRQLRRDLRTTGVVALPV
jgi:hypothetical protein